MDKVTNNIYDLIGKVIAESPVLSQIFGSGPDYTYYEDKKKNRYFYTKEKINHKGSKKYVAGIYRYIKTKNAFKLVRTIGFAKKKKAIEWAYNKSEKADLNNS